MIYSKPKKTQLFLLTAFCLTLSSISSTVAQEIKSSDEPPKPSKRTLKISDVDQWQRVSNFTISNDGKWQGHVVQPNEGDGTLMIAQLDGDKKHKFTVGSGSGNIQFSHDSKWVGFIESPLKKAADAARKAKKPIKRKLVLINLETEAKKEFENVQSFSFSGELTKYVAIGKPKPAGRPSGEDGWDGTDLILHELGTQNVINIGNVRTFRFNKSGELLAMTIDAEGKSGNGIQLFETDSARISSLINEAAQFKSLSWTEEGDALVCLKSTKDKKFEKPLHQLVAFKDFGKSNVTQIMLDPAKDQNIPDGMTISPNRPPNWTEDLDAILFGIHSADPKEEEKKASDDDKKPEAPKKKVEEADLVIWHWKDKRLQSQQQVQESRDKNQNFLCIYRVEEKKTIRLGTDEIPNVRASEPYRYAIGTDSSKYELSGSLDGRRYQDVYTIDLVSGARKLILEKSRYSYDVSPSGDLFLYYQEGNFFVYDMAKGESRNITQSVPVSFINTESDVNVKDPPRRPMGWTSDGQSVLLSDGFDIWKVPVAGSGAENLTGNGTEEQIRYRSLSQLYKDHNARRDGYDLSKDIYVNMYGEWTKKSGFGLLKPGQEGVKVLKWEDASYRFLSRVEDTDVYYFSRDSYTEPSNYFVCGPEMKDAKQVTKCNEQQANFFWSSGNRLVDYTSEKGDKLQAALFLPANYIEGKKYPTIVYMYEKLSQRLNSYDAPRYGGFCTSIYTSQGYAVLMPDITYVINDPGMSSKGCVLPALQAAIDTGVVDPENVGLHGHSWGGYQTAFLITQTDKFSAAVAGAPLTNMISMYSSIYWNSGGANMAIFESSQGRFTGGFWTNIEAYTRNSPVYFAEQVTTPLLLLHNDKDGAVDWNQGIEYFNTLRRMGKPVVMLQYKGENHGLRKEPNRKDYSYRMMEFFNNHLKGKPAAKWWAEGVKHLDHKEHITEHREKQDN